MPCDNCDCTCSDSNQVEVKKPTYEQLARQNAELIAGLNAVHVSALGSLKKASTSSRMASGVMVQLTAVGGAEIISPVMVRDGLSDDTIEALRRDITRSLELTKSGV